MKVNANQMRPGHILEHNGKLMVVLKTAIVQPGKGGAFIQLEMKDVRTGNKMVERFRTQESVERAVVLPRLGLDEAVARPQRLAFAFTPGALPCDPSLQAQHLQNVVPIRDAFEAVRATLQQDELRPGFAQVRFDPRPGPVKILVGRTRRPPLKLAHGIGEA